MFIDYTEISVKAGDGGDGAVAFRKEKFVPKGGPAGGDGGNGGNVIFRVDTNLSTLLDLQYKRKYEAENGARGGKSQKDGKKGADLVIRVPAGTLIKDKSSGEIIFDLKHDGEEVIGAKGGKGGRGNSKFATSTNQTPRFAEDGTPGEEKNYILELKLIADVGLVGFPNAGKSTLISTISAARPKIADYPFTTLEPNLGIVRYKDYHSFTVADIPGIIEGAHEGKGLGIKFLKHIERTNLLLLLIDCGEEDISGVYNTLISELHNYSEVLENREKIVVLTKIDLLPPEELEELKRIDIPEYKGKIFTISSVINSGVSELLDTIWQKISSSKEP